MDILDAPDVKPVYAAGIELMREVPFDLLTPLPLHPLASLSPDAPPVPIHRFLFGLLACPLTPSPLRFRDVRPHSQFAQSNRNLVAVISLVRHYFLDPTGMYLILAFRWFGRTQVRHRSTCFNHCRFHRCRVAGRATVRGDRYDRP